jgi:hypothetical protein
MVEKIRRLVSFKNVRFLKVMTNEVVVLHAVNYCRSYIQWCAAAAKEGDDGQQRQQQEIKIEQQQSTVKASMTTTISRKTSMSITSIRFRKFSRFSCLTA